MAVERAKLEAAIEEKLKGKSLTKNFKTNIAAKYCEKIENDEAIDAWLDTTLDILLEANSEADRRATEAAQKAKGEAGKKDEGTPPSDSGTPPATQGTEPKSEIDELKEFVKSLAGTVTTMQQQRQHETITERFTKEPEFKGLDADIIAAFVPKSDEEYDSKKTALAEIAKRNKLAAFGNDAPPSGQPKNPNEVSSDMKAYLASKKPATT